MKHHRPARILNESGFNFMGLSGFDLIFVFGGYSFLQPLLYFFFNTSLVIPLFISIGVFLILLRIRNKYRRHFLRDLFLYLFVHIKSFGFGVYYGPENY